MMSTLDILPSRSGNLGIFTLNRPNALNALSLDMIRTLNNILPQFTSDKTLKAILIESSSSGSSSGSQHNFKKPCFCAGGDVKAIQADIASLGQDFFREEYRMNNLIANTHTNAKNAGAYCPPTPIISIWDGITMGAGVGLSIHGSYRIATEHTVFSMPETAIGLFPDVGSMFWLPRLDNGIGNYVALTGARLKADDLMYTNLATHYIPSVKIPEFRNALVQATISMVDENNENEIAKVLTDFSEKIDSSNSFLARHKSQIDHSFHDKHCVEDIIASLEDKAIDKHRTFEKNTLQFLDKMSPTSLKITHEAIQRSKHCPDIRSALMMEYRLMQRLVQDNNSDFFEGVRALLVDKDKNPKWNPARLEHVSKERVLSFFESHRDNELTFLTDETINQAKL